MKKLIKSKTPKQITFTKEFKYTVIVVNNKKMKVDNVIVTDNWKKNVNEK